MVVTHVVAKVIVIGTGIVVVGIVVVWIVVVWIAAVVTVTAIVTVVNIVISIVYWCDVLDDEGSSIHDKVEVLQLMVHWYMCTM